MYFSTSSTQSCPTENTLMHPNSVTTAKIVSSQLNLTSEGVYLSLIWYSIFRVLKLAIRVVQSESPNTKQFDFQEKQTSITWTPSSHSLSLWTSSISDDETVQRSTYSPPVLFVTIMSPCWLVEIFEKLLFLSGLSTCASSWMVGQPRLSFEFRWKSFSLLSVPA